MDKGNILVGIDLDRRGPQICYYDRSTQDTQTAPMKSSSEGLSFEDILEQLEELTDNTTLSPEMREENLRKLETQGARVMSHAFKTLGIDDPGTQIGGIAVTAETLTRPLVTLVQGIYRALGIDRDRAFLQDYRESFYFHTMYQKQELWFRNVGFFHFSGKNVTFFSMGMDNMTRPIRVGIDEGITIRLSEDRRKWDEQFYNMANASLRQNMYTSIFLMGDAFDKSWAGRSIGLLCKGGRKVFVVDNLFARGACYAAREKMEKKRLGDYLFLGEELIRNSIGMDMIIQGAETYYPLISAGVNWYETEKECECLLAGPPELIFTITGMEGGNKRFSRMRLTGMPERPPKTTRIRLHLSYASAKRCVIEVEDLGFGDFFPASGRVWREIWEG